MKDFEEPETVYPEQGPSGLQIRDPKQRSSVKTKERSKKKTRLITESSSSSGDSDYSIQDSVKEFILSTSEEELDPDFGIPDSPQTCLLYTSMPELV